MCPPAPTMYLSPLALKVPLHLGLLLGSRPCQAPSDSEHTAWVTEERSSEPPRAPAPRLCRFSSGGHRQRVTLL